MKYVKIVYNIFSNMIPSMIWCLLSGIPFDISWVIRGRIHVLRSSWLVRKLHPEIKKGTISIGNNFHCNNRLTSNSVGIFQPCFFNISASGSQIVIGNNVGISGSTINATTTISIGDNTIIGSGCLITDTDSHPIRLEHRIMPNGGGGTTLSVNQLLLAKACL